MATFQPNPNEDAEPWMERAALAGQPLRVWHVGMFCLAGVIAAVVLVCCCVRLRIPRTKQEIEANYRRRKLVAKFEARVKLIHNQDMDDLDLKAALDLIQADYNSERRSIEPIAEPEVGVVERLLGRKHANLTSQHDIATTCG